MIKIFGKKLSINRLLSWIIFLSGLAIIILNVIYYFVFNISLASMNTFIGLVLFLYAGYQLFFKKNN